MAWRIYHLTNLKKSYIYQESTFCDVVFLRIPWQGPELFWSKTAIYTLEYHVTAQFLQLMLNQLASASKSYLFMVALVTWTVSNAGVKVGLNSVTATRRVNTWAQLFIGKCVTFESSDWLMTVAGTSQYWPNFCLIYFQLSEQAPLLQQHSSRTIKS